MERPLFVDGICMYVVFVDSQISRVHVELLPLKEGGSFSVVTGAKGLCCIGGGAPPREWVGPSQTDVWGRNLSPFPSVWSFFFGGGAEDRSFLPLGTRNQAPGARFGGRGRGVCPGSVLIFAFPAP